MPTETEPITLGDEFPKQQARVREVLEHYQDAQRLSAQIDCRFAIAMIKASLAAADRAAISGDVVEMLRCYNDLKEIE